MKKNGFAVLLMLILAAAVFAAGGQQQAAAAQSGAGSSIVTAPGTFPVVNSPVTLKVFAGGSASIENFETNEFTKSYEQKTGVKLSWQVAPPDSVAEQRRLSIASGDLPDFYMNAGFTRNDEVSYGKDGVFAPLNNVIDTYGYWIKDMFKEMPESRSLITAPDGNIYGLPFSSDSIHTLFNAKLYINSAWLKALNLKVPSTTAEFQDVLRAFKTKDPNGNGKADEIPLITFQPAGNGTNQVVPFFVNSFIQMDMNGFYVTKDDKVDIAYNKPEFRQALQYLNGLVNEGLLDPTSFSITQAQLRQLAEDPAGMLLGSVIMQAPSTIYAMTSPRQMDLDAIAPMQGPNGVRLGIYWPDTQVTTGALIVTTKCKYPEVVMRWVDWFFSLEGILNMRIGRQGIEWDYPKPGDLSYTGEPAQWINIGSQGGSTNLFWMQYGVASYNRHSKQLGVSDDKFYGPEGLNTRLYKYTIDSYVPYKPDKYLPPMYFEASVLDPISQPLNDVTNYRNQMWARFITGDLALNDANWTAYVNTLNQMGIANIISAYQKTYDNYLKNAGK
ncbi:MAG: extracellular solute-binding protein [Treponema sp.]|nr:extracellular solute-binding protein [Treponema sp.]